jgi:hypothetical protein
VSVLRELDILDAEPAPAFASACAVSYAKRGLRDIAELKHATPVKACTSLAVTPSASQIFHRMLTPSPATHLSGFWLFLGRSANDLPIESPALRAQPVNLPSPNSARRGLCRACHNTEAQGKLRHATPVKACISLTVRSQLPRYFTECKRHRLSGLWLSLGRSANDLPIESHALRAQPVNLPSPNSTRHGLCRVLRKTRTPGYS